LILSTFLDQKEDNSDAFKALRQSETTGRPAGSDSWIEKLEVLTGRKLKPLKRGPKANAGDES